MRNHTFLETRRRWLRQVMSGLLLFAGLVLLSPAIATAKMGDGTGGDLGPYAINPQPLTVAQCAQCHPRQFGDLKQAGGKHRFACQDCHEVFHAYNPLRNNYAELMPRCANCHEQPHGARITDCLSCHTNPHSPLQVKATAKLGTLCADCHTDQAKDLKAFPSAHGEVGCQSCHHEQHGYIPQCFECHGPHYPDQPVGDCTGCHPVHKPLQNTFSVKDNPATCAACHGDVYGKWKTTKARHGQVNCTVCHESHGQIPDCRQCHQPPHGKKLLEMFPDCLTCHLDVHNMPVKKGKP